jgi:hypothetical protein
MIGRFRVAEIFEPSSLDQPPLSCLDRVAIAAREAIHVVPTNPNEFGLVSLFPAGYSEGKRRMITWRLRWGVEPMRTETLDRFETDEAPARQFPLWLATLISAVVGTGFGIGLTMVSVVFPRQKELSRAPTASEFLNTFSPEAVVKLVDPDQKWLDNVEIQDSAYLPGSPRLWGRNFQGTVKVKSSEQAAFFNSVSAQIQASYRPNVGSRGNIWPSGSASRKTPGKTMFRHSLMYNDDGLSGSIQIWGIGIGDELTMLFSIHER